MPVVVGIRFKDSGKTYFFDPNDLAELEQGDTVIVETVRGLELAKVAAAPHTVTDEEVVGELKPVIRRAEAADFERMRLLSARHDEVMSRCAEKIGEHDLPMRLVKAEYSFDGSRLTFYFTSEKRVDFRMLVRDLARTFKTRIELRQIGPRDEAKLLGGIGPCGRLLCCATFLPDYARVSIKMAKDQDLPLNPTKISGVCGRLLCCLSYEHDQYLKIKGELPRKGAWVQTPDGPGEVISVNVIKETVIVQISGSNLHEEYSPSQISESTQRVGNLARSRAEEGVTPFSLKEAPPKRERPEPGAQPPQREDKHRGERRLLRNEIDDLEVLEALALLEEGLPDDHDTPAWESQHRSEPPRGGTPPPPRTPEARPASGGATPRRRPVQSQGRSQQTETPRPQQPQQPQQPPQPPQQHSPPRQPQRQRPPHLARQNHQRPQQPERRAEEAPPTEQPTQPENTPASHRHRRKRSGRRGGDR